MNNHSHLMVTPESAAMLARIMQYVDNELGPTAAAYRALSQSALTDAAVAGFEVFAA